MNCIDATYMKYQKDEFVSTYNTIGENQATEELGCFIEYLFAKYRVVLEYIQQIMEICIPPKFNDTQREEYETRKKAHTKFKYLLKYVADNIDERNFVLNMEWFQGIRIDRDFIIHDGATCLVFGDKANLLFKVMTTDAMEKEDVQPDMFYSTENGLIDYVSYWGLQLSKLIVFAETIMNFLIRIGTISDARKSQIDFLFSSERNMSLDDGTGISDKQDVLDKMLNKIINKEYLEV